MTPILGEYMRRIRMAIFLIAAGLLAYGYLTDAERGEDGSIVDAGDLSAFALCVGDCFSYPINEEIQIVGDVEAIPCAEPHQYEVFALPLIDPPVSTYPGEEAIQEMAASQCFGLFENYVGKSYAESILDFTFLVPTPESWSKANDREILCALVESELELLTGSMRGSGI